MSRTPREPLQWSITFVEHDAREWIREAREVVWE